MSNPAKPKKQNPKQQREEVLAAMRNRPAPDAMAQLNPRALALRIGIGAVVVWGIAFAISGVWPKIALIQRRGRPHRNHSFKSPISTQCFVPK